MGDSIPFWKNLFNVIHFIYMTLVCEDKWIESHKMVISSNSHDSCKFCEKLLIPNSPFNDHSNCLHFLKLFHCVLCHKQFTESSQFIVHLICLHGFKSFPYVFYENTLETQLVITYWNFYNLSLSVSNVKNNLLSLVNLFII